MKRGKSSTYSKAAGSTLPAAGLTSDAKCFRSHFAFRAAFLGACLAIPLLTTMAAWMLPHAFGWRSWRASLAAVALVWSVPGLLVLRKLRHIVSVMGNEFHTRDAVAVNKLATYQDPLLLQEAMRASAITSTVFQPMEGFCALASVNTALCSLPGMPMLPLPRMPGPLSLTQLRDFLEEKLAMDAPLVVIEAIEAEHLTLPAFRQLCADELSNPRKGTSRLLANFHRTPLFFSDRSALVRTLKLASGHWSPLGAYLPEKDLVLVMDVNEKYGSYLVPCERLWLAVRTRDHFSRGGKFRGMLRIKVP